MKIVTWQIGNTLGVAATVFALLTAGGCAHRELTAPCSDYKAASFSSAAAHGPGTIPCDNPVPLVRPPWTAAVAPPDRVLGGSGMTVAPKQPVQRHPADTTLWRTI